MRQCLIHGKFQDRLLLLLSLLWYTGLAYATKFMEKVVGWAPMYCLGWKPQKGIIVGIPGSNISERQSEGMAKGDPKILFI